jgi:hypothetical protein
MWGSARPSLDAESFNRRVLGRVLITRWGLRHRGSVCPKNSN